MKQLTASLARRLAAAVAGALVTIGTIPAETITQIQTTLTGAFSEILAGLAAFAVSWVGSRVWKRKS